MDIYEAWYTTRAMRRLKPDPIPYEVQACILDEAIRAPNIEQGWRFLLVDDAQIKAQLAPLAPPQGALRAGHSRTVQPSETPKRRRNRGARPYHGRAEGSGLWCVFGAW